MSAKALALAAVIGLLGAPEVGNATPAAPFPAQTGIAAQPEFLPVRDGCGRGFYLASRRDQWGRWRQSCRPIEAWRERGPWGGGGWGGGGWSGGGWGGSRGGQGWGYYR